MARWVRAQPGYAELLFNDDDEGGDEDNEDEDQDVYHTSSVEGMESEDVGEVGEEEEAAAAEEEQEAAEEDE